MFTSTISRRRVRPRLPLGFEALEERTLLSHGPVNTVSGEAFGVFADMDVASAGVTAGPTPHVTLPPGGGMENETVLSVNVPGVVASNTLVAITSGAIGSKVATSQSSATVEDVNILGGLITSSLVVAMASCTGNGNQATSSADGSTLLDLSINGGPAIDVTPAPNTTIAIPGGTVTLNEQITSGDGKHNTELTVNMIHVRLQDPLTGLVSSEIIVSSAECDVHFKPVTKSGPKFMTGGGRLGTGRDIATFGFHAGIRDGAPTGGLQYIDHKLGMKLHATSITSFSGIDGTTCVTATGTARVNGVDGYSFTVKSACDNGEPGTDSDTFDISVVNPNGHPFYSRSGTLTGGNLQLHP